MKKIGVISDVHGNLQALEAALDYLRGEKCCEIVHTGDVVNIGAQSRECLETLLQNNVVCVKGNHDIDFEENNFFHKKFSHVAGEHKKFVFETMKEYRETIADFPMFVERVCGGKHVVFEHYCRLDKVAPNGYVFVTLTGKMPTVPEMDDNYRNYDCDAVFFGHQHKKGEYHGKRLYVDVGSVGCHPQATAEGIVITFDDSHFSYKRFAVPYDQDKTKHLMTQTGLVDGEYLYRRYYLLDHNCKSRYFDD